MWILTYYSAVFRSISSALFYYLRVTFYPYIIVSNIICPAKIRKNIVNG